MNFNFYFYFLAVIISISFFLSQLNMNQCIHASQVHADQMLNVANTITVLYVAAFVVCLVHHPTVDQSV